MHALNVCKNINPLLSWSHAQNKYFFFSKTERQNNKSKLNVFLMRLKWRSLNPPFAARKAERLFPAAARLSRQVLKLWELFFLVWRPGGSLVSTFGLLRHPFFPPIIFSASHISHAKKICMPACKSCWHANMQVMLAWVTCYPSN